MRDAKQRAEGEARRKISAFRQTSHNSDQD
jgi:hypothetical protein